MSFLEHLDVLRKHIIRIFKVSIIFFIIGFILCDRDIMMGQENTLIAKLLLAAKPDFVTYKWLCAMSHRMGATFFCDIRLPDKFYSLTFTTQFILHIRIALVFTIVFGFPYAFHEIWKFVKPALRATEMKITRGLTFFVSLMFTIGGLFGFFVILPMAVNFFFNYSLNDMFINQIQAPDYFKIAFTVILAAGVMFQLPITIYFLAKMGLVGPRILRKRRKHAIVVILIISAIITPPDVVTQVLISLPIFILYEVSILIAVFTGRKARREVAIRNDEDY